MQTVIIKTAESLSEETYRLLCEGFRKKLGEADFQHIVDPTLIGGFIAEVGGVVYDTSISSQLAEMQKRIKE